MNKNVTIYQIAKESGVSVSTVSRVLNNSPHVSPKSLEKVRRVIDKYNFSPSTLARAMISNRTETLGVILPDITNPYFSSLFLEIQRYALKFHFSIVLCNTLYGGSSHGVSSPFNETQYFQMMADKKVDGVIITGGEIDKEEVSEEYMKALRNLNRQLPVVIIGQNDDHCGCIFLDRNPAGGVVALVQHLAALGNQRIAFVGGEPGVKQTRARLEAYKNTLELLRIPFDQELVALSDYYWEDGYQAMKHILESNTEKPSAVVAINDMVAIGAVRAINDKGLRVPEDIAIASCDQFFESEYVTPRLTSLDQQPEYLGRIAIMTLLGAINGTTDPVQIEHTPKLIIRESCGAKLPKNRKE